MWPNKVFGKINILIQKVLEVLDSKNVLVQKILGLKNVLVQKIGSQKSRENWVSNSLDYVNRDKFH